MRPLAFGAGLLLLGCAARVETLEIPRTDLRFDLVYVDAPHPFWIGRREVTWAEFDAFCEHPEEQAQDGVTRPSVGKSYLQLSGLPPDFMQPGLPVTNLRYHSAMAYCEWLSRRTGQIFRLPTDLEWEAACRADATRPLEDQAWLRSNSGGRPHPGGGKQANALGLDDVAGNVWEYSLESLDASGFEPVLRGGAWNSSSEETTTRKTMPPSWNEADPNRPFSSWWFRSGHSQGFRIVRVPESASAAERDAYAKKIEIRGLKGEERTVRSGRSVFFYSRVTGELRNGGDRALDEVELKVYFLDPKGKPHLEDLSSTTTRRATYNHAFPVLVSSGHPGPHAQPLRPGETRAFAVDVPSTFDADDSVQPEAFGASLLYVRFSR